MIFRGCESHAETSIDSIGAISSHLLGESAFYGRERQSLGERGGWAKGTQDQGVNRQRLKA